MEQRAMELAERIREDLSGTLRAVAVGDSHRETYEIGYLREEIRDAYPEGARDEIFREIVMEQMANPQQAALFGELGEPQSTVRTFENGTYVIYWDDDRFAFVSFSAGESSVPPVIAACREAFAAA